MALLAQPLAVKMRYFAKRLLVLAELLFNVFIFFWLAAVLEMRSALLLGITSLIYVLPAIFALRKMPAEVRGLMAVLRSDQPSDLVKHGNVLRKEGILE